MVDTARVTSYTHDGLRFDVRDEGPLEGTPVLLLHGFPQTSTCWDRVAPLLHERGLRTLAPDQRGYSPGARPTRRRDYRLRHLTRDVLALADLVGGPVHVVGHDWGAMVAWAAATVAPERVASLTAVSVPHPAAYLRAMPHGQARRSGYILTFQVPGVAERALSDPGRARAVMRRSGMSEELADRFWREFGDGAALHGGLMWYRALPLVDRRLMREPVRVPTTMVWSDGDDFLARAGAQRSGAHVRADYRLEILEGVSHWVPDEVPADLARIIGARVTERV